MMAVKAQIPPKERFSPANTESLLSAILKFQAWQREYESVEAHSKDDHAAWRLMKLLELDADRIMTLIGGSNAPIFHYAAREIEFLRERVEAMNDMFAKLRMTVQKEPDDELPWLTEELLLEIDGVMNREYRK